MLKDELLHGSGQHEDRRPLDNHFGAWVIHTEKAGPVAVAALDENGTTLAQIQLIDP
jgi:hypothetical protein